MHNNSRSNKTILVSSLALIVLSVVLFLVAMSIRDFGQPGQQTFFNGRSGILLVISFIVLAGLSVTLLFILSRTLKTSVAMTASRLSSQKNAKKTNVLSADSPAPVEGAVQGDSSAQILSDAAGELRTSVGAIQEGLEDLIDDEDPEEKEHMQSLLEETDRLRKIIDGMEQLSQAQALARALRKESIKLEPLLNAVMEKSRLTAQGGGVTFTLECDPALGITGDPDCLRRILENLMDNAVKAVKNAGSVTLAALRKGDEVVFSVKDTGTGIRPKHLSHIYERFFRGTGTGIGMGLTIVKELVDACEGKIEVQTEPGKGSVFTLHIPSS